MQIVDVLGNQQEVTRPFGVQSCKREVGVVRLDLVQLCSTRVIEAVNQLGIESIGLGRANILNPVAFPQTLRPAEGREAAFRADARPCQDDNVTYPGHRLRLSHPGWKSAGYCIDTNVSDNHSA